jgi:hypothetical protein
MNTLPVWVHSWAIQCCGQGHVATVGKPWSEVMLLSPSQINRSSGQTPGWTHDGEHVEFTGTVVARADGVLELDLGAIVVGLEAWTVEERWTELAGTMVEGTGQVWADWHTAFHPDLNHEVTVEGTVRKISTVKSILEWTGERSAKVVGYEPPVEAQAWPPRYLSPTVIVELEISSG